MCVCAIILVDKLVEVLDKTVIQVENVSIMTKKCTIVLKKKFELNGCSYDSI